MGLLLNSVSWVYLEKTLAPNSDVKAPQAAVPLRAGAGAAMAGGKFSVTASFCPLTAVNTALYPCV